MTDCWLYDYAVPAPSSADLGWRALLMLNWVSEFASCIETQRVRTCEAIAAVETSYPHPCLAPCCRGEAEEAERSFLARVEELLATKEVDGG